MWPTFTLPGMSISISSYHLLHVVAWFTFYLTGSRLTRSRPDLRAHWFWLAVGLGLCDTVGARAAFRAVQGSQASGFFATPLLFAVFTGIYCLARKVRAYPLLDAWAVAFATSHVFEKLSCLAAGCCYGRPTDSALGVAIRASRGDLTRYQPLPLLEAALHLVTALVLGLLYRRGRLRGQLVMVLGVLYGFWRSGTEMYRGGPRSPFLDGPLTWTQVACVLTIGFGLTYLATGPAAEAPAS